jgi:hypothetical protein
MVRRVCRGVITFIFAIGTAHALSCNCFLVSFPSLLFLHSSVDYSFLLILPRKLILLQFTPPPLRSLIGACDLVSISLCKTIFSVPVPSASSLIQW